MHAAAQQKSAAESKGGADILKQEPVSHPASLSSDKELSGSGTGEASALGAGFGASSDSTAGFEDELQSAMAASGNEADDLLSWLWEGVDVPDSTPTRDTPL